MREAFHYAPVFGALGHEARLRVLQLLLSNPSTGLVAGRIQQELDIPASTLSHHLDSLRQVGLIEQRREGRFLRYRAAKDRLNELLGFIDQGFGVEAVRAGSNDRSASPGV